MRVVVSKPRGEFEVLSRPVWSWPVAAIPVRGQDRSVLTGAESLWCLFKLDVIPAGVPGRDAEFVDLFF